MVRKHKAALTRAKKRGPLHTIAVCEAALRDFDTYGWPDQWADWERAKVDAELQLFFTP
jgi:hypothetical protein